MSLLFLIATRKSFVLFWVANLSSSSRAWACSGPSAKSALAGSEGFATASMLIIAALALILAYRAIQKKTSWLWSLGCLTVLGLLTAFAFNMGTRSGDCGESSNYLIFIGLILCGVFGAVSWQKSRGHDSR